MGTILTVLLAGIMVVVLPYAPRFAAGAMLYAVVEELIPEMSVGKHSNVGTILFADGFTLMMTLDVALGACVSEGEKMGQEERIQNAYRGLGGKRTFYDGMITCSTLSGRAVCSLVWEMGRAETQDYLCAALSGIPEGFSGRLLEVPVGTGILTMPLYREMPEAEITCLDY